MNLLHLDTSIERWRQLEERDQKLVDGLAAIDVALKPLAGILSGIAAVQADTQAITDTQRSDNVRKYMAEMMS